MCPDLFDFDFDEQQENLERVASRIGRVIMRFLNERLDSGRDEFHADELRAAVIRETGIAAPGSADRILRDLRQRGLIDYIVVNRRESLYRVISVTVATKAEGAS